MRLLVSCRCRHQQQSSGSTSTETPEPELEERSIASWPDGLAFYLIGQLQAGDTPAVWTADCAADAGTLLT